MEQSSVRMKGNLGQGRNRSPGCKPSLSPLQTDFPLPYFLALNSLHRKPQSQPWGSYHLSFLPEFAPPSPSLCLLPAAPSAAEPTELPGTERGLPGSRPRQRGVTHRARVPPPPAARAPAPAGPSRGTRRGRGRWTAATASPADEPCRPQAGRGRGPRRGSAPLGAAGASGTSGSSAPSCARTGARPTALPARAERRNADGPPPRPASPPDGFSSLP